MKPFILATTVALLASQSHALSCMRPDPISTFQQLAAAPERYFVVHGTLTFDESLLPEGVGNNDRSIPDPIPGQFIGKGLSRAGFTTDYIGPITLQVGCAGPWCGSAQSGAEGVYFIGMDDGPPTAYADACGGMIFPDVSQQTRDMLRSCMQGGTCTPLPFE